MNILINLSETPNPQLADPILRSGGVTILDRAAVKSRTVFKTLGQLRNGSVDKWYVYCDSARSEYKKMFYRILGLLSGSREIRFCDRDGVASTTTPASFVWKDLPKFVVHAVYACGAVVLATPLLLFLYLVSALFRPVRFKEGSAERVCYLKTDFWFDLRAGGALTHTAEFIDAGLRTGHEIQVVSADPLVHYHLRTKVEVVKPPACMTDFPAKLAQIEYNLRFPLLAFQLIRRFKPAVFYQRYSANNVSGVLLSYLFRRPFVLEFNSSAVWAAKNWSGSRFILLEKLCEKINLRGATRIAVVSEEMKRRLVRAGVPQAKVIVNPNGVNPAKFSPAIDCSDARRALPQGKTLVGFIGIFGQWHGVLTLAAAVKHVVRECPEAHFVIIGDGPLKSDMLRILERDGASEHVTFVGVIKHDQAPACLNACAILVSPHEDMADGSPFFGSPTKLFEYMAMGKGIVASRVGQLGEILEDGVDVLFVQQRKPEELARAISSLIKDPQQCLRLGTKAREKAISSYTWERNFLRCVRSAPVSKAS